MCAEQQPQTPANAAGAVPLESSSANMSSHAPVGHSSFEFTVMIRFWSC